MGWTVGETREATMTGGDHEAVFQRERPHLLAVAFRILGSDADAQDIVQEAWTRYATADLSGVRNVAAWLTTVVTRLCLDALRRARERPHEPAELPVPAADVAGPEDVALLAGELTEAMTVVVTALTPPQRVALILHDVFGTPFEEVAHILETTPGAAKKLASRARARLRGPVRPPHAPASASASSARAAPDADPAAARDVVAAFLRAARDGDVDGLVAVLDPDVVRTADPQALPPGAGQRVRGARRVVEETRALRDTARRARLTAVHGRPAIAVGCGPRPEAVLVFRVAGGRIAAYDVIADPYRLAPLLPLA